MTQATDPQFITSDRYMVAYFLTHGLRWTSTSYDGRTASFLFPLTPRCADLQEQYRGDTWALQYRDAVDEVWDVIRAVKAAEETRDE